MNQCFHEHSVQFRKGIGRSDFLSILENVLLENLKDALASVLQLIPDRQHFFSGLKGFLFRNPGSYLLH